MVSNTWSDRDTKTRRETRASTETTRERFRSQVSETSTQQPHFAAANWPTQQNVKKQILTKLSDILL